MDGTRASRIDPACYALTLLMVHLKRIKDILTCMFLEFAASAFASGLSPVNRRRLAELKKYFTRKNDDLIALGLFTAVILTTAIFISAAFLFTVDPQLTVFLTSILVIADNRSRAKTLFQHCF